MVSDKVRFDSLAMPLCAFSFFHQVVCAQRTLPRAIAALAPSLTRRVYTHL